MFFFQNVAYENVKLTHDNYDIKSMLTLVIDLLCLHDTSRKIKGLFSLNFIFVYIYIRFT